MGFSPHCNVKLCDSEVSQFQFEISVGAVNEFNLSMHAENDSRPLQGGKKKAKTHQ